MTRPMFITPGQLQDLTINTGSAVGKRTYEDVHRLVRGAVPGEDRVRAHADVRLRARRLDEDRREEPQGGPGCSLRVHDGRPLQPACQRAARGKKHGRSRPIAGR